MNSRDSIAIVCTFLWIGFVCAISFMEAWLKFQAPGITVSLGLGIGRLVFDALNKVEWVFAIAVLANGAVVPGAVRKRRAVFLFISILILIGQTAWLLPALDARAELHIQNALVPHSNLHLYYVIMEVVKVLCLSVFGILLFKPAIAWNTEPEVKKSEQ